MKTKLSLWFGALSESLSKQITDLGLRPPKDIEVYQRAADNLNFLYFQKLITQSERSKAEQRILKKIAQDLNKGGTR